MSRKKQEALSVTLTNSQEFQDFITAEGKLSIIDAHPRWTGPCKSVVAFFKRLKLEIGNPMLRFGVACIEDCAQLDNYKDTKPEPLFLFYAEGVLVGRIRGCDGPLLDKITKELLAKEEKILAGEGSRVEISPTEEPTPVSSGLTVGDSIHTIRSSKSESNTDISAIKQMTLSIITPKYIEHCEEIIEDLKSHGIECLQNKQIHLTEEDLRQIIPDLEARDGWEAFLEYITSSTSVCLVLTRVGSLGVGVVSQMNLLAGPADQETAQKEAPDSVNSIYGSMTLFTSSDKESADGAIVYLFPDFVPPTKAASAATVSGSTMDFRYALKTGDNQLFSEEISNNLTNFGCKILGKNDEENVVVLACQRSMGNLREIIENLQDSHQVSFEVTDEGVDGFLPSAE